MKRRGAARVLGIDSDPPIWPRRASRPRCGARHRVPQAVGLRRRRARRALRHRAVHGRALPPAPSAAGARPDPRARRRRHVGVPVDAARKRRGRPVARTIPSPRPRHFDEPGYPKLHFIERRYAGDPTNWWVPNRACAEAMLRSAGFAIVGPSGGGGLCLPPRPNRPSAAAAARLSGAGADAHDRSGDDLERAQQQVALGPELDPDWARFAEMAPGGGGDRA
jgi:hypothetical protein